MKKGSPKNQPSKYNDGLVLRDLVKNSSSLIEALDTIPELLDITDSNGWTLLHHACAIGSEVCFNVLIERGAWAKQVDKFGNTPLHVACRYGYIELSQRLVQMGCDIKQKNSSRVSALECVIDGKNLIHIANLGNYPMMRKLLNEAPRKINNRDSDGWTALHWCCANGWRDCAKLLLERGAKTKFIDKQGRSVYHILARFGHSDLLKLLVDSDTVNASIEINRQTTRALWSPLHFACFHNHIETAALMIEYGANTKLENADHHVAMHYLYDDNHKAFLRDLVEVVNKSRSKLAQLQGLTLSDIDKPVPGATQPRGAREQTAYLHNLAQSKYPTAHLKEYTKGLKEHLIRDRQEHERQLKYALEVLHEGAAVHVAVAAAAIKASLEAKAAAVQGSGSDVAGDAHTTTRRNRTHRHTSQAGTDTRVADVEQHAGGRAEEFNRTQRDSYFKDLTVQTHAHQKQQQQKLQQTKSGRGGRVDLEKGNKGDIKITGDDDKEEGMIPEGMANNDGDYDDAAASELPADEIEELLRDMELHDYDRHHHHNSNNSYSGSAAAGGRRVMQKGMKATITRDGNETIPKMTLDIDGGEEDVEVFGDGDGGHSSGHDGRRRKRGSTATAAAGIKNGRVVGDKGSDRGSDDNTADILTIQNKNTSNTTAATMAAARSMVLTAIAAAVASASPSPSPSSSSPRPPNHHDGTTSKARSHRVSPSVSSRQQQSTTTSRSSRSIAEVVAAADDDDGNGNGRHNNNAGANGNGDLRVPVVRALFAAAPDLDDTIDLLDLDIGAPELVAPVAPAAQTTLHTITSGVGVGHGAGDSNRAAAAVANIVPSPQSPNAEQVSGAVNNAAPTPTTRQLMDYRKRRQWMYEQQQKADEEDSSQAGRPSSGRRQHEVDMEQMLRECEEDERLRLRLAALLSPTIPIGGDTSSSGRRRQKQQQQQQVQQSQGYGVDRGDNGRSIAADNDANRSNKPRPLSARHPKSKEELQDRDEQVKLQAAEQLRGTNVSTNTAATSSAPASAGSYSRSSRRNAADVDTVVEKALQKQQARRDRRQLLTKKHSVSQEQQQQEQQEQQQQQQQQQVCDDAILRDIENKIILEMIANVKEDDILRAAFGGDDDHFLLHTGTITGSTVTAASRESGIESSATSSRSTAAAATNNTNTNGSSNRGTKKEAAALEGFHNDKVKNLPPDQAFKVGNYRHTNDDADYCDDGRGDRGIKKGGGGGRGGGGGGDKTVIAAAAVQKEQSPRNSNGGEGAGNAIVQLVPTPPTSSIPSKLLLAASSAHAKTTVRGSRTNNNNSKHGGTDTGNRDIAVVANKRPKTSAARNVTVSFADTTTTSTNSINTNDRRGRGEREARSRSSSRAEDRTNTTTTNTANNEHTTNTTSVPASGTMVNYEDSGLSHWLCDLQLQEYIEYFHDEGFRLISDFDGLSKEDCDKYFGSAVKRGDLLRLKKEILKISPEAVQRYETLGRVGRK